MLGDEDPGGEGNSKSLADGSLHPGSLKNGEMFRLLLPQVSQSVGQACRVVPFVRCPVVCRVSFSGARKALVECSKKEEVSNGEDKRAQSVFEYVFVSFVFSRVPVRQANIYQSSPAQLFSASLIISTLRM